MLLQPAAAELGPAPPPKALEWFGTSTPAAGRLSIVCSTSAWIELVCPVWLLANATECRWAVRRLTASSALCVRRVMTSVEQKGCAARAVQVQVGYCGE